MCDKLGKLNSIPRGFLEGEAKVIVRIMKGYSGYRMSHYPHGGPTGRRESSWEAIVIIKFKNGKCLVGQSR